MGKRSWSTYPTENAPHCWVMQMSDGWVVWVSDYGDIDRATTPLNWEFICYG
jgi:hypothetical protein